MFAKDTNLFSSHGNIRDLSNNVNLQSRTKFMKQCQEIKQNWAGQENFEICFCVIFDY